MKRSTLKKAKPEDLKRLANWLKLRTDGMSHRHIAKLVHWRITRESKRLRGMTLGW